MAWARRAVLVCLLCAGCAVTRVGSQGDCTAKQQCGECMREANCVWCTEPNATPGLKSTHCASSSAANGEDWCAADNLVDPRPTMKVLSNEPLQTSSSRQAVQISPQGIELDLRVGQKFQFNFSYAQAEDYPVDIYFLMDLSASMKEHKNALSELGQVLATEMKKLTKNVKMGFGSFVDKTEMPFVSTVPEKLKTPCVIGKENCAPPYSFKNHLPLTENIEDFRAHVKKARLSGNLDFPEGGFDGLLQAMVCTKEIGWRENARHMLIFSTDANFHIAGDGKLAGVVQPNDGLCHMKDGEYTHALLQDYPSIGQISEKAKEHNMVILFTVFWKQEFTYTELKKHIDQSEVGLLHGDSSNVVDLVKKVYESIVDSVTISDNSDSSVQVEYHSSCLGGRVEKTSTCRDLHVGTIVNFTATVELKKCPAGGDGVRPFQIKPSALDESLQVNVRALCSCACEAPGARGFQPQAARCSANGDLQCGVCSCYDGKFGRRCECDGSSPGGDGEDTRGCRRDNSSDVCSGLGACKCGQCVCQPRQDPAQLVYGQFCECKNYTCEMRNGLVCAGNGICECGDCVCLDGWSGSACDCSTRTDRCMAAKDDPAPCSGNGACRCGKCECAERDGHTYTGQHCNVCPTCPSQCEKLRPCVECLVHGAGAYHGPQCRDRCHGIDLVVVDRIDTAVDTDDASEKICHLLDESDCTFVFKFAFGADGRFNITAQKEKTCSKKVFALAVAGSVIGSILLAGIVLLIMWKVLTTIHDRREYAKFENERKNANWSRGENPLFKNPLQTFQNPSYGQ